MDEEEIRDLLASVYEAAIATKADRASIPDADYVFPQWKKCPITSQRQANSAAKLIAKVVKPDGSALTDAEIAAAKTRAKRIMKRKGFAAPKAWQATKGGKKEAAYVMSDQMKMGAVQAALDADDDPDCDGDNDRDPDDWRDWGHANARHIMPDNTVVFQMGWDGDWFSRPFAIDDDGEATLGMPCVRVLPQLTFEPAKDQGDGDTTESRTESASGATGLVCEAMESVRFEATDDGEDGFTVSGTAIMPGINRSKTRIYPTETLKSAVSLFKGTKMYVDHPTREDERNGVRSFRDAAAVITEAWVNPKGGIDYRASVFDPPTREKLSLMAKAGALDAMGVSVNYQGIGSPTTYEGYEVDNIDSIDALNSLDFVTEPGAWGSIDRFESVVADAIKREAARPAEQKEVFTVDEETRKLIEGLQATIKGMESKIEASDSARAESDRKARIANTKVAVKVQLEKSGLPQVSQDRILASYDGAEEADDLDTTIEGERKYIEELTESLTKKAKGGRENVTPIRRRNGVVVGMGNTGRTEAKVTGTEDRRAEEADDDEDVEMTDERGMQALEGFIPDPKQFAANMG
jgi:hypothetical protein